MNGRSVWTVTRRELRESLRHTWLWAYVIGFAGLATALSGTSLAAAGYAGLGGFGRTAASLVNALLLFVPLLGLSIGAGSVAGDRERGTLVRAVQHRAVLHVHPVADADRVHIAPHHRMEPHAAALAHHHVAHHHGVLGQEAPLAEPRLMAAHLLDQRHAQGFASVGSFPQPSFWQQAGSLAKALGSPGMPSAL